MELTEQKHGNALVVGVVGRLDTTNYGMLEQKLIGLIDGGNHHILVDCARMDYVSSSGLRILLMALKRITQVKGRFILAGLQENIREIFEISGFTSIFDIRENVADALTAME